MHVARILCTRYDARSTYIVYQVWCTNLFLFFGLGMSSNLTTPITSKSLFSSSLRWSADNGSYDNRTDSATTSYKMHVHTQSDTFWRVDRASATIVVSWISNMVSTIHWSSSSWSEVSRDEKKASETYGGPVSGYLLYNKQQHKTQPPQHRPSIPSWWPSSVNH